MIKYLKVAPDPFEEKAPDQEEPLSIVIARANTMDLDGDIFEKYKWKKDGVLMSPWGHNMAEVPVAHGTLSKRADDAIIYTPQFLNGDEAAMRTERALRAYWKIVEFSYAFFPTKEWDIVENSDSPYGYSFLFKEVEIYETSAVHKGASIDTGINKDWRKELAERKGVGSRIAPTDVGMASHLDVLKFKARIAAIEFNIN